MNITKLLTTVFVLLILHISGAKPTPNASSDAAVSFSLNQDQKAFLDTLQYRTFLYFWQECNPDNGLVKDRSTSDSPASIAATGFGVVAWAVGVERGWISREQAADRTLALLTFLTNAPQGPEPVSSSYRGFFYHFLDMDTGLRKWECELSTVDTAWLLAGIRFAVQYYNRANPREQRIRELGNEQTRAVRWDFMTMPDSGQYGGSVSMGWYPDKGLHHMGWIGYNEAQYLYILAAGSGYKHAETAYQQWLRDYQWFEPYPGLGHVGFPPLFGHQYTQVFLDLRNRYDDYMKEKYIDYFENSRRATLAQWYYARENPLHWEGYDSLTWGWTACDGPGPTFNHNGSKFRGYAARGMIGKAYIAFDDGTIAPTAAGGSIVFAPEIVVPTLMSMYNRFKHRGIWGKYGFVDAFNLSLDWFDKDYLGIDQGPILLMIENFRSGLVWNYCMQDSIIKRGLKRLNFVQTKH